MAKKRKAPAPTETNVASLTKTTTTALVKKDLKGIQDYAARLDSFLKDPGIARIRVCECCIQVR